MPAVEAKNLVLGRDGRVVVDESTFTIPEGTRTAVVGANGSGKSTLLDGIVGLLAPMSGRLTVLGAPPRDAARRVAMVAQSAAVNDRLPVTVREVVEMGRYASTGMFGRLGATDRASIDEAMSRLRIEHLARRPLWQLSGGERQRVFVAQGLAQDHDLLLLDEPLTAIDAPSAAAIRSVIDDERAAGRTVILTTHDLSDAESADLVVVMAGRVVACGPPDDVLVPEVLEAAYGTTGVIVDDPLHPVAEHRHVHFRRAPGTHEHD